jgi:outer membrane biosynthesis protein TonB
MRKLLLSATVLMISAAAYADPSLRVAENDQPPAQSVVITTEPTMPAEPTQAVAPKSAEPTKAVEPMKTAEPTKPAEPAAVAETKPAQTQKAKPRSSRRESDEEKARRIAAKFGIYW